MRRLVILAALIAALGGSHGFGWHVDKMPTSWFSTPAAR